MVEVDPGNSIHFNHQLNTSGNTVFVKKNPHDITAIDDTMRMMKTLKALINNKEKASLPDYYSDCHRRYHFNDTVDERILSMNLVPLTLGVRVEGGYMADVIPRNTSTPVRETRTFSTLTDHQRTAKIVIFEGEDIWPIHNHYLGEITLHDLPLSLGGAPKIDISFIIDTNNALTVKVHEQLSGQLKSLHLGHPRSRLNQDILDEMLKRDGLYDRDDDVYLCEYYNEMMHLKNFVHLLRNELSFANELTNQLTLQDRVLLENNVKKSLEWLQKYPYDSPEAFKQERKQLESAVLSVVTGSHRSSFPTIKT